MIPAGANRPCLDCGTTVTRELTGTFRAPFYAPCPVTGAVGHRVHTCTADSGSATGNRPVCSAPAVRVVTVEGYGGPHVYRLCDRHADHEPARAYPYRVLSDARMGVSRG